ncbi:hypothetical protein NE857_16270 [Nocardiopsis exhalans]|uniref:Uncharacterized protein n=1 Tax=Nocardiopsis exhalans TaxID=163604 RepID=A0ABY5DIX9_9ACTN|nr:hypothetical protein [Nocardiopsis exhalans]USY23030.1 hypothetical protein NE857_16270 [Nocardiopsis exhalans]
MTLSLHPTPSQAPARRPLRIRHALALRCPASPGKTTVALNRSTSCALADGFTLVQDDQDQQVTSTS